MTQLSAGSLLAKIKLVILWLERNNLIRNLFSPLRYVREILMFERKTRETYKWIAQFYDPQELNAHRVQSFLIEPLKATPIKSKIYPGLWNTNPTISIQGDQIKIFLRATNMVFNPVTNSRGHNSLTTTHPITLELENGLHSVVRNALISGFLNSDGILSEQSVVLPESEPPCFEDARAFSYSDKEYLIGTWTTQVNMSGELVIRQSISIYSISEGLFFHLNSPFGLSMEKNWVPIEIRDDCLIVFYSSQPAYILRIDLKDFSTKLVSIGKHPFGINFHGRSQFIKLPNDNFLRVASVRLPVKDFGLIHFSFLVEHSPEYQEIRFSKPFFFSTPGFEICNGLGMNSSGQLIFSWGCNDKTAFFSGADLNQILDWLNENEIKVKNPNHKGYRRLRRIFGTIEDAHLCKCKQVR